MQSLTFPQKRARERGLSAHDIARKMNCGKRLTGRELDNRAAMVARVLKRGNCGPVYARRLGRVLDLEGVWLELPLLCWPAAWRPAPQSAVETPSPPRGGSFAASEVIASDEGARRNARPHIFPRAQSNRVQVLRLVP